MSEHKPIWNSPEEFKDDDPNHMYVGLIGRETRDQDSKLLKVIHIEDKR